MLGFFRLINHASVAHHFVTTINSQCCNQKFLSGISALDRAEIIDTGEVIQTPSGDFSDILITRETTPLEPDVAELKYYAAGIGLIQEEDLMLQRYGFIE